MECVLSSVIIVNIVNRFC